MQGGKLSFPPYLFSYIIISMTQADNTKLIKAKFFIPSAFRPIKGKEQVVNEIFDKVEAADWLKFAGFLKKKDLKKHIFNLIGDNFLRNGNTPIFNTRKLKDKVEASVLSASKKCQRIIPLPVQNLPIYILTFPWFPKDKEIDAQFGGVNAFAPYSRTLHLFINTKTFTQKSIRETIAHEWNHLAYYNAHCKKQYSILDRIIMEGLAEVFREEIFNGGPSPWSTALNRKETKAELEIIRNKLFSKSFKLYEDIAYGSSKFKRWTGYSIGYMLVKDFRGTHKNMPWKELVLLPPQDFLGKFLEKEIRGK